MDLSKQGAEAYWAEAQRQNDDVFRRLLDGETWYVPRRLPINWSFPSNPETPVEMPVVKFHLETGVYGKNKDRLYRIVANGQHVVEEGRLPMRRIVR